MFCLAHLLFKQVGILKTMLFKQVGILKTMLFKQVGIYEQNILNGQIWSMSMNIVK
jgi:hypothetical protein